MEKHNISSFITSNYIPMDMFKRRQNTVPNGTLFPIYIVHYFRPGPLGTLLDIGQQYKENRLPFETDSDKHKPLGVC